jgi:hypothetical protein
MTDKKTIVVCGDSFNYGIGCVNQHTQPYGVLTAKHFDWDLVRLARGSASNYVIHLQGKYAARMNPKPHLVILGTTSYDRLEWLATGKEFKGEPRLEDVNYHLYPPHHHPQPLHDAPMPYHLAGDPNYQPKILSEQMVAIPDFLHHIKTSGYAIDYYKRLHSESIEKLNLINTYYFDIFDSLIKRDYDVGVISMAYRIIKNAGINCVICSQESQFKELVEDERDYFFPDWGRCTATWPDSVGSLHTGEGGHKDIANRLISHIETYNLA